MKQIEIQADGLPNAGFVRLAQIIGRAPSRGRDEVPALIPVQKSCWWEGVKSGKFPPAVYLGNRLPVWRVEHIRALIKHGKWSSDLVDEAEGGEAA